MIIEVRASDSAKKSAVYADIFHQVPIMMLQGKDPNDVYEDLLRRADFYGCSGRIQEWLKSIRRSEKRFGWHKGQIEDS